MTRRSIRVILFLVLFVVSCRNPAQPRIRGGNHKTFANRITCDRLATLQAQPATEPLRYELISQAYMDCWRTSHKDNDARAALHVLDDGIARFPNSANLLLSKGYRYRELGENPKALEAFRGAASLAGRQISANQSVAANTRIAEDARQGEKDIVTHPVTATARRDQEVLLLLEHGKCKEAVSRLEESRTPDESWYELLYMANIACSKTTNNPVYRNDALRALEEGTTAHPGSVRLLAIRGGFFEFEGNRDAAIHSYEQALQQLDKNGGSDETSKKTRIAITGRLKALFRER